MALLHQKSGAITDLDGPYAATPVPAIRDTTGLGSAGTLIVNEATIAIAGACDVHSTFQLFRVPSNCKVKWIDFVSPSQGATGIFDIGAAYPTDHTNSNMTDPLVYNGTGMIDVDCFGHDLDTDAGQGVYAHLEPGGGWTVTNATFAINTADTWTAAMANTELWNGPLALSSDPGGNIDIVATLNEAIATGAVSIYAKIGYIL
jgi:hypothetical protein